MSNASEAEPSPGLVRALGARDGALITIGSVVGTGIFLTTADMARVLPHPSLILAVWVVGGLLTLAGALTYAELGVIFPRAGGQYHYLKEAYGPFWGFLFGWTSFFVVMSGGIATLAVGFGEYLGYFLPFFSTKHVLFSMALGPVTWAPSAGQMAGVAAIVFLTAVNYVGLKSGAGLQSAVTLVNVGILVGLAALGLLSGAPASPRFLAPLPGGGLLSAFGVAMIAALWTYDGWYNLTFSAGEMKNPARSLPVGLILGTLIVTVLYTLVNVVYVRALPVKEMAEVPRVGEATAQVLFGSMGAKFVSAAVLVSTFGCLSSNILCCSRIYQPMAEDGLFFRALARIHPRYRVPGASLVAQGLWASVLCLSGTYEQLYTYVIFGAVLLHAATGIAVFVLRRKLPDVPRPYRVWGYPWVPALFVLSCGILVANTLLEKPRESALGLGLLALGLPAFLFWRSRSRREFRPAVATESA